MSTVAEQKIVQIHPTRTCNLACLHCYSSSGPAVKDEIAKEDLLPLMQQFTDQGYHRVSFSGGEPFLYGPLAEVLAEARRVGLRTSLTTNGMASTKRRLTEVAPHLDALAISLDGTPDSHNRMRNDENAFRVLDRNMPFVKESGIPFGFIFTLTKNNLDELDWVIDYALRQGASLMQIHPLEAAGRARETIADEEPDVIALAQAKIAGFYAQADLRCRLHIQVDVMGTTNLAAHRSQIYADDGIPEGEPKLADLVSPLVIETDGTISPLQYGFPKRCAVGSIHEATLEELTRAWQRTGYPRFRDICRSVYRDLTAERTEPLPVANWYQEMSRQAEAV